MDLKRKNGQARFPAGNVPSLSRRERGQAAIEFLTTYGWAVLVLVIVLVALGWLGVFNVQQQVPDRCTFPFGTVTCADAQVTAFPSQYTTNINRLASITLRNDFRKQINVCAIVCSAGPVGTDGWPIYAGTSRLDCNIGSSSSVVQPGQELTLQPGSNGADCYDAAGRTDAYRTGSRYLGKVYVSYGMPGEQRNARIVAGDLVATVQNA